MRWPVSLLSPIKPGVLEGPEVAPSLPGHLGGGPLYIYPRVRVAKGYVSLGVQKWPYLGVFGDHLGIRRCTLRGVGIYIAIPPFLDT